VRALATTGAERNIPPSRQCRTIGSTVPGLRDLADGGIVVPAGTPPEVVARLSDEIVKAMSQPDVKERVLKTGAVPDGDLPRRFRGVHWRTSGSRLGTVIAPLRDRADGLTDRGYAAVQTGSPILDR
jgi:hypothetical protein